MIIHEKVYCSDSLSDKKDDLIEKIKLNRNIGLKYLITIPVNNNQLEMFRYVLDKQRSFDTKSHVLIGIASDYDSGIQLIEEITKEVYEETNGLDYKKYFLL